MVAKNVISPSAYYIATKLASNPLKRKLMARVQKEYEIFDYFIDLRPVYLLDSHWDCLLFEIPSSTDRLRYFRSVASNQHTTARRSLKRMAEEKERDVAAEAERKRYEEGGMGYGTPLYSLYKDQPHLDTENSVHTSSKTASSLVVRDTPKIVFDFQYVAQSNVLKKKYGSFLLKNFVNCLNLNYTLKRVFPIEFVNCDLDNPLVEEFLNQASWSGNYMKDREYDYPNIVSHPVIHKYNPYQYSNSKTDPSKKVVFMSRHSKDILDGPLVAGTYIIPVTADLEGETYSSFQKGNYHVMRFPVDKYLRLSGGDRMLYLHEVIGSLGGVAVGDSWKDAMLKNVSSTRLEGSSYEPLYENYDKAYHNEARKRLQEIRKIVHEAFGESEQPRKLTVR